MTRCVWDEAPKMRKHFVSFELRSTGVSSSLSRIEYDTSVQRRTINSALSLDKSHKEKKKRKIIMQFCCDVFLCTSVAQFLLLGLLRIESELNTISRQQKALKRFDRESTHVSLTMWKSWKDKIPGGTTAQASEWARDGKHFSTFLLHVSPARATCNVSFLVYNKPLIRRH